MSAAITTAEVEAVARQYDEEYRGGTGRGDIDTELAERLAAWFNDRLRATSLTAEEARAVRRVVEEMRTSEAPLPYGLYAKICQISELDARRIAEGE